MSIAAQRAITDMRKRVQAHVLRLPVSYFDSTKTGVLISRIMTDAEGIRNLVGTGLDPARSAASSPRSIALGVLFYLNWKLTSVTLVVLLAFGGDDDGGVQAPAAAVPRARRDQRRSHGPAGRDARRHSAREGRTSPSRASDSSSRAARTSCSATSRRRSPARRPSARQRRSSSASIGVLMIIIGGRVDPRAAR